MSQLYHSIVYNNKDVRDICHYPKHKHLPFSNSLSKVAASFELLHFDIWGPISISCIHGHKYFLTIFDDHRRFLWIILLKTKDKVSTRVKNFIAMIKNQFNTTPKFVRTDNVPEFLLYDFYSSHDIVHQKSSVETCQQNGRVERKRQHILNVGKALLFQSKLPPSFWSYVILHVVFFINRVSTPILNHKSCYHLLFHQAPYINLFKVFGCMCYASTLYSHRSKLQPRAKESLFLGYKSGNKGNHLFDLNSR